MRKFLSILREKGVMKKSDDNLEIIIIAVFRNT